PLRFSLGHGLADWLERRAGDGASGAFVLGTAFSLAFCPTLFLLFFGLTIPLALASPVGVLYPGLFAVGTALPLLLLAGVITAGVGAVQGIVAGAGRVDAWLRPAAARPHRPQRRPPVRWRWRRLRKRGWPRCALSWARSRRNKPRSPPRCGYSRRSQRTPRSRWRRCQHESSRTKVVGLETVQR